MTMTFKPSVYSNQRPMLTPADLDNHPLAQEYIDFIIHMKFPPDFSTWLRRRKNEIMQQIKTDKEYVARCAADPYCRNPRKIRRHDPPSRTTNFWIYKDD